MYPKVVKEEMFFQLPILVDNEVFSRDTSKQSHAISIYESLLKDFGMPHCKPISIPTLTSCKLSIEDVTKSTKKRVI